MPTTEKRGRKHRGLAFHAGQKINAGTFSTKAEAMAAAIEIERRARAGKLGTVFGHRTFGDLLEKYAEDKSAHKPTAENEKRRILFLLRDPIAKIKLSEIQPTDFTAYVKRRKVAVKESTILRDFNLMSHAFTVAVDEYKWIDHSPLSKIAWPKDSRPRDRIITDDEIEAVCIAAGYSPGVRPELLSQRVGAALLLAVETGMRSGEILALAPADVHLDQRRLHVRADVIGGKKTDAARRDVPLSTRAIAVLNDVLALKRDPVFDMDARQRDALFRKLRKMAGVSGFTFHDSRATAITKLSKKMDPLALARMIGHKHVDQLMTYYRPTATELADLLD